MQKTGKAYIGCLGILDRLEATGTMKKPSRKTKNHYKKTIIEVSDKLAIWIDTLTKFVDVQVSSSTYSDTIPKKQ